MAQTNGMSHLLGYEVHPFTLLDFHLMIAFTHFQGYEKQLDEIANALQFTHRIKTFGPEGITFDRDLLERLVNASHVQRYITIMQNNVYGDRQELRDAYFFRILILSDHDSILQSRRQIASDTLDYCEYNFEFAVRYASDRFITKIPAPQPFPDPSGDVLAHFRQPFNLRVDRCVQSVLFPNTIGHSFTEMILGTPSPSPPPQTSFRVVKRK
ncbi:MAG: hypothetical protein L6R37_006008 [Teloschistes peruensis]|nr:MAG: hypothetical protein L6R37_006008 [Teloschistes peruensis]